MKQVLLGLVLVAAALGGLLLLNAQQVGDAPAGRAALFFERSNVRVNYENGQWFVRLDTPEVVLCALNVSGADDARGFARMTAQSMTTPSLDHDVALSLEAGKAYRLLFTAFTPSHKVLRSKTYSFTAQASADPQRNLIEASQGEATTLQPQAASAVLTGDIRISEVTHNSAQVAFNTRIPTLASTAYARHGAPWHSTRLPDVAPFTDHRVPLLALEDEATYQVEVTLIDAQANVYRAQPATFETQAKPVPLQTFGPNVAAASAGALISAVSSNWANGDNDSSFGANNAIDGDPNSEWSSNGEGNDAWIEITLAQPYDVDGLGLWSRTMVSSAQISRFRALTGEGVLLGEFEIPDANALYQFRIPKTKLKVLRFEVVDSSGGNTGVRQIEVYRAQPSAADQAGAKVVGVSANGQSGAYTFSVTVQSPDTGCDQYVDWWEVLDQDGTLLYRRVLAHSHVGEQPFTRSGGPVTISQAQTVIVRAHMNTSGYGRQAMQGNVASGFEALTLPPGFADEAQAQEPLPTSCAF